MSEYAGLVGDHKKHKRYQANARKIKEELQAKLYNGNINLFCDYLGPQWQSKVAGNGHLAEPLEWRDDSACGKAFESSLKLPGRCNQPYTNDEVKNAARCCRFSYCTVDPKCDCPSCVQDMSIDDDFSVKMMNSFSTHIGIVNFFPLMFGLIEDEDQVKTTLKVLGDPDFMLGRSGIRSLSKSDQFYLHSSNYWRGAIWINVNFLVLRGLQKYYMGATGLKEVFNPLSIQTSTSSISDSNSFDTAKALYEEIRHRLIDSIYKNWRLDHVFWE